MMCLVCGCPLALMQSHDHKADNSGLDDGPPLNPPRKKPAPKPAAEMADNSGLDDGPPLNPPRKKPAPKPAAEMADIRARAWATRRQKYGKDGHR